MNSSGGEYSGVPQTVYVILSLLLASINFENSKFISDNYPLEL